MYVQGASLKTVAALLVRLSNSPITRRGRSGLPLGGRPVKRGVLPIIWLPAWLAIIPVALLTLPPASSPAVTLSGAAAYALPVSLAPLAIAALILAGLRRQPDGGVPVAATFAALVTIAMGSSLLDLHTSVGTNDVAAYAHAPTVGQGLEAAEAARDRALAETSAGIMGAIALALAALNALLYYAQPTRGPRRIVAVAGLAAGLGTAGVSSSMISPWTDQSVLVVFAASSLIGLALIFVLLVGLTAVRWVRSGFSDDRSQRTEPTQAEPSV